MTTIFEVLDTGATRIGFAVSPAGHRTYVASYTDHLPVVARNALRDGWDSVILLQKRTGMIADGKGWEAWVGGKTPAGPFWAFTESSARFQAEDFIRAQEVK